MKYFLFILFFVFSPPAIAEDSKCGSIDTEFQMYDCLASHYEESEKKLRATYNQALYRIDKAGKKKEKLKKLLEDSQQNWISYRETACMAETFDIDDEQKSPLMMRLCYMRLADRRTEDIKNHFKTWEKKRREQ